MAVGICDAMNQDARAARPEEAEGVLETLCAAFGLSVEAARPIFYGDPYYALSHKRVLWLPPLGVVSCLTVVPTAVYIGGIPVPVGGVAGVATHPEYQRRGHAAALMEATVPALWEELGYPLSMLHPLSPGFYRRFGWEVASRILPWSAVPSSLPRFHAAAQVRPALPSDWPAIYQLQADLTHALTGACVRDPRRWSLIEMPIPGREAFVCEATEGVTGYVLWERHEALQVLEMQGRSPDARRALIGHLACQAEPIAEWAASPALLHEFDLTCGETPPEPDAMLRIVDLPAALSAVHAALYAPLLAASGATLTICATDPQRPANMRPLRLTPDGVVPGTDRDPSRLLAGIRVLAQLYLGYQTPSEAQAAGLLTSDSAATLALADRLFPAREPYIAPLDQV